MPADTARYLTSCACPGDKDRVIDVENVIFSQRCARCGGILSTEAASIYQAIMLMEAMKTDLHRMLGTIDPPGEATIAPCSECRQQGCPQCDFDGRRLYRCCIQCSGVIITCLEHKAVVPPGRGLGCPSDHVLVCLKCRFLWAADDPRWVAQRLPGTTPPGPSKSGAGYPVGVAENP
jgi:hypothetical protein